MEMAKDVPRGFNLANTFSHEDAVDKLAWSKDGSHLASICNNCVYIWNVESTHQTRISRANFGPRAITWSPDGLIAIGMLNGNIEVHQLGREEPLRILSPNSDPISSLAWSPNGKILASGSELKVAVAYQLFCWDTDVWSKVELVPRHTNEISCLSWSPDSRFLLSGSHDFYTKIWDAEQHELLSPPLIPAPGGELYGGDWFPDGNFFATGAHSDIVIWSMKDFKPLHRLKGHTGVITNISISKQSPVLIATKSLDGTLRLWDTKDWIELALLVESSPSSGLAFHPQALRLATVDDGNAIRIWDLEIDALYGRTSKPLPRSPIDTSSDEKSDDSSPVVVNTPGDMTTPQEDIEDIYDIAIVCALATPELDKVKSAGGGNIQWTERNFDNDAQVYYTAQYESKRGVPIRIIASSASQMGLTTTAVLTAKMIYRFLPKCVIMVGIAAGTKADDRNFGDILAATTSFDYGSGKITMDEKGSELFLPNFDPISIDPKIKHLLIARQSNNDYVDDIRNRWPAKKPPTALKLHYGPVASGAAVINSIKHVDRIRQHWRKVIGVEMEIYGVFSAGNETIAPSPYFMAFKSVCDFAEDKNDNWQDYAAFTAAEFCYRFIVNDLWDAINKPPERNR
jgi:nucleoside phosphorylase